MPVRKKGAGFTLIELMIVVAILGVIALIAVPKFADLIRKSNESATRGHMGSIRSALSIYYSGTEGIFPEDLSPFLLPGGPFSLASPPQVYTANHGTTVAIDRYPFQDPSLDTGRWGYVSDGGIFWVVCMHPDISGRIWSGQ